MNKYTSQTEIQAFYLEMWNSEYALRYSVNSDTQNMN